MQIAFSDFSNVKSKLHSSDHLAHNVNSSSHITGFDDLILKDFYVYIHGNIGKQVFYNIHKRDFGVGVMLAWLNGFNNVPKCSSGKIV